MRSFTFIYARVILPSDRTQSEKFDCAVLQGIIHHCHLSYVIHGSEIEPLLACATQNMVVPWGFLDRLARCDANAPPFFSFPCRKQQLTLLIVHHTHVPIDWLELTPDHLVNIKNCKI
jgi:hypothetical protein